MKIKFRRQKMCFGRSRNNSESRNKTNSANGIFPRQEKKQIRLAELFRSLKICLDSFRNYSVLRNCFWSANGIVPIQEITLIWLAEFFYKGKLNKIEPWNFLHEQKTCWAMREIISTGKKCSRKEKYNNAMEKYRYHCPALIFV